MNKQKIDIMDIISNILLISLVDWCLLKKNAFRWL